MAHQLSSKKNHSFSLSILKIANFKDANPPIFDLTPFELHHKINFNTDSFVWPDLCADAIAIAFKCQ